MHEERAAKRAAAAALLQRAADSREAFLRTCTGAELVLTVEDAVEASCREVRGRFRTIAEIYSFSRFFLEYHHQLTEALQNLQSILKTPLSFFSFLAKCRSDTSS